MFIIIGLVIVIGSILTGFTLSGGKIAALIQINELIVIGGAAAGSVVVANGIGGLMGVVKAIMGVLKGNPYNKEKYLELLHAMYDLFVMARKDGLIALEKHVETPEKSEVLGKYKFFMSQHHALAMFADTMKLVVMGGVNVYDLSDMMEIDMEAQNEEAMKIPGILTTIADGMPGFGIVAAVLGVVVTMAAIGGPPEVIGEHVGAALVGTFMGILLAYGVFAPISKACESIVKCESQYFGCIKNAVVAFARGDAPLVCVEFARRYIEPEFRPGFSEMEAVVRGKKAGDESSAKAA